MCLYIVVRRIEEPEATPAIPIQPEPVAGPTPEPEAQGEKTNADPFTDIGLDLFSPGPRRDEDSQSNTNNSAKKVG